jgi:hypothetical protein
LVPYVEAFEEAARLLPALAFREALGRTAPELARILPEVHRLFPDLPPSLDLPPELRQRFLFNNIQEFLSRCSQTMPLAIFLDDLPWADESRCSSHGIGAASDRIAVILIGASATSSSRQRSRRLSFGAIFFESQRPADETPASNRSPRRSNRLPGSVGADDSPRNAARAAMLLAALGQRTSASTQQFFMNRRESVSSRNSSST